MPEVLALEEGARVWVEPHDPCDISACVHAVVRGDARYQPKVNVIELTDRDGWFWGIEDPDHDYGVLFRVWALPQDPTAEELAANPWPGGGTDDERA